MKRTTKRVAILLVLLLILTSSVYPQNAFASEVTKYSLANHYYRIKSLHNGAYLLGNNAGYEAQANTKEDAMVFYMKPSALGEYMFYDRDSRRLNINTFGAIIRDGNVNDSSKWRVEEQRQGLFSIYSVTENKYVGIKKTSLVFRDNVDDSCLFSFEETTGNHPFPEADPCVNVLDNNGKQIPLNEAMSRPKVGDEIVGYADTHAHLNHFLGSGQATFVDEPFHPLGITKALKDCTNLHGVNGAFDIWSVAVDGKKGHDTSGYPNFGYWPTSYSTDHQQTYYKWLERSYLAGQRVLVHQCVNNELLGNVMNALPPYKNGPTDDMTVADLQLNNILEMQDYIDAQCGGPGKGWFRIVTSAKQARQVISEGKMAVFLSFEFDRVFGAKTDYIGEYEAGFISKEECNKGLAKIEEQLNYYYDKGVRSIFTVHALNNGFGGCQIYQGEIFSIMNCFKTGDFYQPEISQNPRVFYKQPKADLPETAIGHGNSVGLTKTGEWFIKKLMEKKMVVEVDHMGDKTFNRTLDLLWGAKYPGVIASHTRILDMFNPEDKAWEQMDIPRMIKVMQLGGVVSPMLWETLDEHQRCVSDYQKFMIDLSKDKTPKTGVLNNKRYEKYGGPYKVPTTWYNTNSDDKDDIILGIPYGSDVNGACMLPNFDKVKGVYSDVNYDDGSFGALHSGVYSDKVDQSKVRFDRQVTGNRTFDINGDRGVAHYGLVPDLIKKFQSRPDRVNTDATFHSAEAYIRMLERVERYSATYPSRDESQWPVVDTEYWHNYK